MEKYGKGMNKYGKVWNSMEKFGKVVNKCGNVWKKSRASIWKSIEKV